MVKKKPVNGSTGVKKRVSKDIDCKYCGRKHIRKKEDCPAWGKSCSKCGMQNHFAVKCRKKLRDRHFMLYMKTMFLKFLMIIVQLRSIFLL